MFAAAQLALQEGRLALPEDLMKAKELHRRARVLAQVETRKREPENGNPKTEIRKRKSENGNLKTGTRNPRPANPQVRCRANLRGNTCNL